MNNIQPSDTEIFYTDSGSENGLPPMILLHGNGGNSSSFFYVVYHFAKTRRVITVDTRGHGRTPKGDKPFTLKQFAEDLYCFMTEMRIEKADIVGYSDGGNIAMLFALSHQEKVSSLVLNGANLFPRGLEDRDYRQIFSAYRDTRRRLRRNPRDVKARESFDLLSLMVNEPDIAPEQLSGIDCPTLVLVGTHDAIKPEHTRLIASSIKGARLAVVEGGHNIVKTNSGDYIKAIEEFYSGIESRVGN